MERNNKIINFTIGADIESFFTQQGKVIPSWDLISGTKDNPHEFREGYGVLCDNVMAEFNMPPASNREEFLGNISVAKSYLEEVAKTNNAKLVFDSKKKIKTTDRKAFEFGCLPFYDIYKDREVTITPDSLIDITARYSGGHIHIGWDNPNTETIEALTIALDKNLLIPFLEEHKDKGTHERKMYYGSPGLIRLKPYGVEYRSLSSAWCKKPQEIYRVYDRVVQSIDEVNQGIITTNEKQEVYEYGVSCGLW